MYVLSVFALLQVESVVGGYVLNLVPRSLRTAVIPAPTFDNILSLNDVMDGLQVCAYTTPSCALRRMCMDGMHRQRCTCMTLGCVTVVLCGSVWVCRTCASVRVLCACVQNLRGRGPGLAYQRPDGHIYRGDSRDIKTSLVQCVKR